MANYDPRKDRHKPAQQASSSSMDALLGPAETAISSTSGSIDASLIDDRSSLSRPVATPEPSGLPQRVPRRVLIGVGIGAVIGAVGTLWIALKVRSYFKR